MADQATQAMLAAMLGGGGSLRGLSDIGAFQQELDNNDMFKALAVPIAQTKFDTSTWSPGTTAGVTAAQAFLSGILGELSKREQAEQMFKVAQVLPQLYEDPRAVSMPEGIDPQAFGKLKLEAVRGNLMRDLERKEKVNDLFNTLFTKKFEAGLDLDKAAELEELKAGLAGNIERAKTRGALEGKQDVYGKLGIDAVEDPESPLYKQSQEEKIIKDSLGQSLKFIDEAFDRAKGLTGMKAGATAMSGIPTKKGNALTGLADSVILQLDKTLGREMNSDVRERVLSLAPRWYDSEEAIDEKKLALKDLVQSLAKPTPLLDSKGVTGAVGAAGNISNVPETGSIFEGKKVLSVKRVK